MNIEAAPLRGALVRLEPLTEDHVPGLAVAAKEDRSGYTYTMIPRAAGTAAYVKAQLTRDGVRPFAQVRVADGAPVGCTACYNQRSHQSIERLGARFEGVLRNWGPSRVPGEEGRPRDSAIFSVIAAEWPQVKSALNRRIQRARA